MIDFRRHLPSVRSRFPALARTVDGRPAIFLDGPAGTQVPRRVIDAMVDYLVNRNANHDGAFLTSRESDRMLAEAHRAVADFVGADDPDTVCFGPNMTTLTFALSRALATTWKPGDEIVVTVLDHDANVSPWTLAARDAGATVHYAGMRVDDCTLDLEDLRGKLGDRTRLVAVGCASNATGGINPVREICDWAREAGALTFLDAVHYAPHGLIDVNRIGCDFLACSAYKFFGPHVGILWGRRELLESVPAYKVRPAPDTPPGKWMTGTQCHEGIAGTLEAVEYLADLGREVAVAPELDRRAGLVAAMNAIVAYERELAVRLLEGLSRLRQIRVWGISEPDRAELRVPTFSVTHERLTPRHLAEYLDGRGIFVWHGNYYALNLTEFLDLEPDGMVRIGLAHYNTEDEVDRLLETLEALE